MTLPAFPALISQGWPVKKTPMWSTLQQQSIGGQDTRFQLWTYPKYKIEVTYELLRSASAYLEQQTMQGFFNEVGGSAQMFTFNDILDNAVTAQGFGTGDGVTTAFQLVRTYGGFVEPVLNPTVAGLTILVNGTPTGAYTLGNYGVINFTSAPAVSAALTWTGNFTWLCKFKEDMGLQMEEFASGYFEVKSLIFETQKL